MGLASSASRRTQESPKGSLFPGLSCAHDVLNGLLRDVESRGRGDPSSRLQGPETGRGTSFSIGTENTPQFVRCYVTGRRDELNPLEARA